MDESRTVEGGQSDAAAGGRSDAAAHDDLAPFCMHLQSKKAFFRALPPREESDLLDASRHCWCRKTMQVLGPDGEFVSPADCRRGRECFRGVFESSRNDP